MNPDAVLEAILAVTRELPETQGTRDVADAIVRAAARLLGADQATLGLIQNGEVVTVASLLSPQQRVGSRFPVGFGVAGWVAATGQPADIPDVREDKRYVALPYPEVRSFVGLPLRVQATLVGVLSLGSWRRNAFPSETASSLAAFAEHSALLLHHATSDLALQERLAECEGASQGAWTESLHDLKAPLASVSGLVTVVATEQAGPLTNQQRELLDAAGIACKHLGEEINRLVEAGSLVAQRPLHLESIDPKDLVEAAIERIRGQSLVRSVAVQEDVEATLPAVRGDRSALLQVLVNLLQNAVRVAPAGSRVTVAAGKMRGWTSFMVADRGPGLSAEDLEAVFQRYRQGSNRGAGRNTGDVGLGLWLAHQVIEQHEGVIWAENREGGGARFCFALPPSHDPAEQL